MVECGGNARRCPQLVACLPAFHSGRVFALGVTGSCQVSGRAPPTAPGGSERHSSPSSAHSMPLLNGQPHVLRQVPAALRSHAEVFVLRITGEVFKEYE